MQHQVGALVYIHEYTWLGKPIPKSIFLEALRHLGA